MADELPGGTTITNPLYRAERTVVGRNSNDEPYFEQEAAVNVNAPAAHSDAFFREFVERTTTAPAAVSAPT